MTAAGTRARVRAELTREIAEVARRHLASEGAAALSLRAVAREMGMASSAVYRYFPSRDDLLTALIVDAYNAIGAAVEEAERAVPPDRFRARWQAACAAARTWALAHPHEYALVYGSPVPGYVAPQTTIGPAGRVGLTFSRILTEALAAGVVDVAESTEGDDPLVPGVGETIGLPAGSGLGAQAVLAWSSVFGLINFELFGHTNNVVEQHERFFLEACGRLAGMVGLPA